MTNLDLLPSILELAGVEDQFAGARDGESWVKKVEAPGGEQLAGGGCLAVEDSEGRGIPCSTTGAAEVAAGVHHSVSEYRTATKGVVERAGLDLQGRARDRKAGDEEKRRF